MIKELKIKSDAIYDCYVVGDGFRIPVKVMSTVHKHPDETLVTVWYPDRNWTFDCRWEDLEEL